MDEATLAGIEQRAQAATEGPWHRPHDDGYGCVCIGDYGWVVAGPNYPSYDVDSEQGHADAEFIAHARTDVPALVAEVRRLSAALDAVRALHERAEGPDGESLCAECGDGTGSEDWPCPTLNALDHPSWCGRDLGHRGPCRTVAAAPSGEPNPKENNR